MKLTRLHRGYAYLEWWSKCGRKHRCKSFDHTLNRVSYNVLCYIGGRMVDFYDFACVRMRVRVPLNIIKIVQGNICRCRTGRHPSPF